MPRATKSTTNDQASDTDGASNQQMPAKDDTFTEGQDAPKFAHPSEAEFARILDFYLPELNLYIELTTLRQKLVTQKNRKLRHLRDLYPGTNIKLLYKHDYHRLLAKYGYGPLAQEEILGIDRVLISADQMQKRVIELGRQVSMDYMGTQSVLIGVLKGGMCFLPDLIARYPSPCPLSLCRFRPSTATRRE